MVTEERQLETMSGRVVDIKEFEGRAIGVKLEGRGDAFISFSKPEYRGHFEEPGIGDAVKLGISHGRDGKVYIKTCEIQQRVAPQSFGDGVVPAGGRDLSIMRQVCVKAAAEIVAAGIANRPEWDTPTLAIDVLALAQDFERWMVREEAPFS